MDSKKIQEIFSDEAFVKSLLELETPEEVQLALEKKGVPLTTEDICDLREQLEKVAGGEITPEDLQGKKQPDGELGEGDLEEVSGGSFLIGLAITAIVGTIAAGATAGAIIGTSRRRW